VKAKTVFLNVVQLSSTVRFYRKHDFFPTSTKIENREICWWYSGNSRNGSRDHLNRSIKSP